MCQDKCFPYIIISLNPQNNLKNEVGILERRSYCVPASKGQNEAGARTGAFTAYALKMQLHYQGSQS